MFNHFRATDDSTNKFIEFLNNTVKQNLVTCELIFQPLFITQILKTKTNKNPALQLGWDLRAARIERMREYLDQFSRAARVLA